jgi:hypothetical protein
MPGVFRNIQNIDSPPPHRPESVYPQPLVRGRTHSLSRGSKVRKTPDTALYSIYVSTLWKIQNKNPLLYPLPSHVPPSLPSIPVFPIFLHSCKFCNWQNMGQNFAIFCLMEGWPWCGNRSYCSSDRPLLRRDRRDPPPGLGSGLKDRIVTS